MTSTRSSREERKNSSFRRVFWWSMGYNRIVTIFYTIFLMAALPVGVLLSIMSNRDAYTDLSQWEGVAPEEVALQYGDVVRQSFNVQLTSLVIPLMILFLLVWCARNFGYMQFRRSVDLFHALPVRRTPLFMGNYAAGLVSTLLPLAAGVALSELLCAVNGIQGAAGNPALFWQAFAVIALPAAGAMTFTVFFMVVSGNVLNWFLMTAAVSLGWPVVVLCADQTMKAFLPGYVSVIPAILYTALCPYFAPYAIVPNGFYYLFISATMGESSTEDLTSLYNIPAEYVLWWILFTVLLLALSVFYYNRRKSECAENAFSFPVARGVVRSLMTVGGALGLGLVVGTLLDSNGAYVVGLVLGAVVAHSVFQAVITRGFRRFWMTVPAFAVTAMVIFGGLYLLYTGGLGYVSRIPNAADVEQIDFNIPRIPGDESKESYLAVDGSSLMMNLKGNLVEEAVPFLTQQEDVQTMSAFHAAVLEKYPAPYLPFGKKNDYSAESSFIVTYTRKDGTKLMREYDDLTVYKDDEKLLGALAQVQRLDTIQGYNIYYSATAKRVSGVGAYQSTDKYEYSAALDSLTQEEQEQVWKTFTEELDSPSFRAPSQLLTAQESAERMAQEEFMGESSGEGVYAYSSNDTSRSYTIVIDAIPAGELTPATMALIPEEYRKNLISVDGASFTVPECCTKTCQLIEQLTRDVGQYYYYTEGEEDEEIHVVEDASEIEDLRAGEEDASSPAPERETEPEDGSAAE